MRRSALDDSQIAETNEVVRDPREAQYCNIAPDWQHTNRRYRIGAYYIDPLRGQDQIQAKRCHWTPTHINGIGYSPSHYHLRSTGFRLRFTVEKPLSISLHMYGHMYLQGTNTWSSWFQSAVYRGTTSNQYHYTCIGICTNKGQIYEVDGNSPNLLKYYRGRCMGICRIRWKKHE